MTQHIAILEISTTVGCRMACRNYCPQKTHVHEYAKVSNDKVMSFETFEMCLATVPQHVSVCFAGMAEPWLNPRCTEMVLHAYDRGHSISVFTTGYGLRPTDIDRIAHISFRHFCVHLPDANGDMNLKPTEEYLNTLRACRQIPNMTQMVIGPLHPAVEAVTGPVADGSASLISRASNLPDRAVPRKSGKLRCSACGPKVDHNVLLPNGDVVLCCMTYDLKHVLGNLVMYTYDDLFRSDEYLRIMRGLDGDESIDIACRNCEISVPA